MNNYREEIKEEVVVENIQLESVINKAINKGLPLALWRRPLDKSFKLVISLNSDTHINEIQLERLDPGFLFCPFEINDDHHSHFLKNDIVLEFKNAACQKLNIASHVNTEGLGFLFENLTDDTEAKFYSNGSINSSNSNANIDYKKMVEGAINEIRRQTFMKIVPARYKSVDLSQNFHPVRFFKKLEEAYTNAFVYMVCIPKTGTWIGATPENLITIEENKIFKTTALAGTQKFEGDMKLTDAAWRQKEIEEQAIVSRYIINCFKKIRLREFEEIGPKTVKAGNLIHLKTDFIVNMEEVSFPQLGSVMLNLLHPTSAVCGMPKETSLQFIHENEGFDRSFFSGYLGPVNSGAQTNLFVNLRCMKLTDKNSAVIFAGAGVTIDSDPEKEWLETEMKMETLLKLL